MPRFHSDVPKEVPAENVALNRSATVVDKKRLRYNRFLLLVAGLGGLLYGVDVGIIGGALPYLEATSGLTASELSLIVAAVLLGSVISTLFAGLLADRMGRKKLMILSSITFIVSIPIIALAHGYGPLFYGRLLQGVSGGFIGVVVPLYLAECLPASHRGRGTAIFQWLLTLGILAAALIGIYFSYRVEEVAKTASAAALFAYKDMAWRGIFWVSLPPGIAFLIGAFMLAESPRWLVRRGRREAAHAALLRSRLPEQAALELREMETIEAGRTAARSLGKKAKDSLLRRKYVIPFVLACIILFCNTATGVNSIIGFNTNILIQSGLTDIEAHWGYVLFTLVNFLFTIVGITLVDRRGRKFLFTLGSGGVILSLVAVGLLFWSTRESRVNRSEMLQAMVQPNQTLSMRFDTAEAARLLAAKGNAGSSIDSNRAFLTILYSYGDVTCGTNIARTGGNAVTSIKITRASCVPATKLEAVLQNPFANVDAARTAPLKIDRAYIGPIPGEAHGWGVAIALYAFMAFFALGPGACVWVALSELMPTRIRSNGMSIALVINQLVSTTLAAVFLPTVGKYGYSAMFFLFAGFTVIYFITAAFFLPETKGKTLEEIEAYFEKGKGVAEANG
ncbi:MAG TPA: MFS transporter [Bryobacteraceae bacterium]